ncbi:hypothetical protein BDW62DRAFT_199098 [Aspergillus aurantiobrunneus]
MHHRPWGKWTASLTAAKEGYEQDSFDEVVCSRKSTMEVFFPRLILRNPATSTLKVFLGRSLGSIPTPAHLLLDTFTESILNKLSDEAVLMLALVTWHFDATSDAHQFLSQQPLDQVISEAPQLRSSESHHLLIESLEDPEKFNAKCGILYERYNESVRTQVTMDEFTSEIQRLLGFLSWLFQYWVECIFLDE